MNIQHVLIYDLEPLDAKIHALGYGTVVHNTILGIKSFQLNKKVYSFNNESNAKIHKTQRCILLKIEDRTLIYSRGSFNMVDGTNSKWAYIKDRSAAIDITKGLSFNCSDTDIKSLEKAYKIMFADEEEVSELDLEYYTCDMSTKVIQVTKDNESLIDEYKKDCYAKLWKIHKGLKNTLFYCTETGETSKVLNYIKDKKGVDIHGEIISARIFFTEDNISKVLIYISTNNYMYFIVRKLGRMHKNGDIEDYIGTSFSNEIVYEAEELPRQYRFLALHIMGIRPCYILKDELWGIKGIKDLLNSLYNEKWDIVESYHRKLIASFYPYDKVMVNKQDWVKIIKDGGTDKVFSVVDVVKHCYKQALLDRLTIINLCTKLNLSSSIHRD